MLATLRYTLRRLLLSIVCWSGLLIGFGVLNVVGFDYVVRESIDPLLELVESLPPPLKALVGDPNDFITPEGFLHAKFFLTAPLLLGIGGVLMGSGLIAVDEEKGRLDLIAAYPISRAGLFWGRSTAMLAALTVIVLLVWVGLATSAIATGLDLHVGALALSCLTLWAAVAAFAAAALLFSLVLPSRILAAGAAGSLLLVCVIVENFAPTMPFLDPVAAVLPLHFYQGGKAMTEFAAAPLLVLLLMTVAQLGVAGYLFLRRDIRVIGEGVLEVRRVSLGAAGWIGAYALMVLIVGAVAEPRGVHRTPEEAFAAAQQAVEQKQWDQFVACLTPSARDRWTGLMIVLGELSRPDDSPPPADNAAWLTGFSRSQLQSLLKGASGFHEAMRHVDRAQLEPYRDEINATLAGGGPPSDDTLRRIARAAEDRNALLRDSLAALAKLTQNRIEVSLEDVEVDGAVATGTLSLMGTTQTVGFQRLGGDWKIDLPVPGASSTQPPQGL
ncbi:MAG: ABC transporter permease subunit [Pirellulaceae bacterium]